MRPLACWFEETVLLKEKNNVKHSYGHSKGQENDPTLNFRHKGLSEWNRGGTVIFTFHIHLSHHQPAKQLNEMGKSAPWKPTGRTWTQRTKQFGGRACRDWLHHIHNLMQELLDLSCYELYSQVCVRERRKHTLKITVYQLWSPSKNHWVAWPFLELVIICEKWMVMKRYSYEFQGCSTERPIAQKLGVHFFEYRPVFSVLHRYGMWIPLGSIAVGHMSLEIKVEDRREREYPCKSKTSELTFQISVSTEECSIWVPVFFSVLWLQFAFLTWARVLKAFRGK